MSYEKEISELWKDWKSSTDKYAEAIEDGYDVDADMWAHDVMEIERQIYVYEQAAKADKYEAKAKAYDAIAINIKALRKHMLNSGKSVNAKIIETENTIKHIEAIIERTDTDD